MCSTRLGIVVEKNWALSVDQCQLQALQFSVHLIDLLSILLRCNDFTGIQEAVVEQTSSRPPNSDSDPFFGFGKCFGAFWSTHWPDHCWLSYKIHFASHVIIQLKNGSLLLGRIREDGTSKWQYFLFLVSLWGTYLVNFFTFPICFKCPMTVEWLTSISLATSHIAVRASALMKALSWSLSTSDGLSTMLLDFEALISAELLEPPLHCMCVSSSWAKCTVEIASCLCCFTTHFGFKQKMLKFAFCLTSFL